jgi:hypothetical protein
VRGAMAERSGSVPNKTMPPALTITQPKQIVSAAMIAKSIFRFIVIL